MTDPETDLLAFYNRLVGAGLRCVVVGSVASSAYGEPRTTIDIDLLVTALPEDAERIAGAFREERYYVPPIETMRRELSRGSKGSFNIVDSSAGLKADIYPAGKDALQAFGLSHAIECRLAGQTVLMAPATYIVAMKLRYFSISHQDKHLRDIRGMLAVSRAKIDTSFVDKVANDFGVIEEWRDCQDRVGEE